MTEYTINDELATSIKSALGLVCREAIESGMTDYADELRDLLSRVDARPIVDQVSMPRETAEKMLGYLGEKVYGIEKYGDLSEDGTDGADDDELALLNGFVDQVRGSLDK